MNSPNSSKNIKNDNNKEANSHSEIALYPDATNSTESPLTNDYTNDDHKDSLSDTNADDDFNDKLVDDTNKTTKNKLSTESINNEDDNDELHLNNNNNNNDKLSKKNNHSTTKLTNNHNKNRKKIPLKKSYCSDASQENAELLENESNDKVDVDEEEDEDNDNEDDDETDGIVDDNDIVAYDEGETDDINEENDNVADDEAETDDIVEDNENVADDEDETDGIVDDNDNVADDEAETDDIIDDGIIDEEEEEEEEEDEKSLINKKCFRSNTDHNKMDIKIKEENFSPINSIKEEIDDDSNNIANKMSETFVPSTGLNFQIKTEPSTSADSFVLNSNSEQLLNITRGKNSKNLSTHAGSSSSASSSLFPPMPQVVTHVGRKPLNGPPCSLKTLVDDGILEPLDGSLAYEIMGTKFFGDLLPNGYIRMSGTNQVFANPSSWANYCRSTLPSTSKDSKNYGSAWSIIRYLGKRLDSYKLRWYRKQKKQFMSNGTLMNFHSNNSINNHNDLDEQSPSTSSLISQAALMFNNNDNNNSNNNNIFNTRIKLENQLEEVAAFNSNLSNSLISSFFSNNNLNFSTNNSLENNETNQSNSTGTSSLANNFAALQNFNQNQNNNLNYNNHNHNHHNHHNNNDQLDHLNRLNRLNRTNRLNHHNYPNNLNRVNHQNHPIYNNRYHNRSINNVRNHQHNIEYRNYHSYLNRDRLFRLDRISSGDPGITFIDNIVSNTNENVVEFSNIEQYLRDPNLNKNLKIKCEPFNNVHSLQPFAVTVSTNVLLLVDFHSHLLSNKVLGYLGGNWDSNNQHLTITHAFPICPKGNDDKTFLTKIKQNMVQKNLLLVGWYHSHPSSLPQPTVQDIRNQMKYQTNMMSGRDNLGEYSPCIGLISAPFYQIPDIRLNATDTINISLSTIFQMFWAMPTVGTDRSIIGRPMQVSYNISRDAFLTQDLLLEMRVLAAQLSQKSDFIKFKDIYLGQYTYWKKLQESLKTKLPRDLIEDPTQMVQNEIQQQALMHFWSFLQNLLQI